MHVTAHECYERYHANLDGGYYPSLWMCPGADFGPNPRPKVISKPGFQAALIKTHPSAGGSCLRGVNFSGGQRWVEGTHSVANPGQYDVDYWYPTENDYPTDPTVNGGRDSFQYLYSEGVRLVRIGFR